MLIFYSFRDIGCQKELRSSNHSCFLAGYIRSLKLKYTENFMKNSRYTFEVQILKAVNHV